MKNETGKSNVPIIVLLMLIIIALTATCTYLVLSKDNSNSQTQNEEIGNQESTTEMTETEKNYFMNQLIPIYDRTEYTSEDFDVNTMSDANKRRFAYEQYRDENVVGDTISHQQLLSIAKKYLGENGTFEPGDIACKGCFGNGVYNLMLCACTGIAYTYNSSTGNYESVKNHGHGAPFASVFANSFVEGAITKENDVIKSATIKVRKAFGKIAEISMQGFLCGTYDDAMNEQNKIKTFDTEVDSIELSDAMDQYISETFKKDSSKYPIYTYTFGYKDGSYYLTSISIEK